ncbi:YdcF family protein [Leptolyngbya sp. BC1307]|uniref:YdcF family protein n=1 Tax=Leptolyngbya sp. BC1307 TaxID=2029589 RepID=UPI000EFD40E2|nr:YdcF family protein [Leptolyngbya sp. BC1307]
MPSKRAIAKALTGRAVLCQTSSDRRSCLKSRSRRNAKSSNVKSSNVKSSSLKLWAGLLVLASPFAGLAYLHYQQQFLHPSVALVLGGAPEREQFAAQFAKSHPDVEIWVSSGSNPEYAQWVFDQARIPTEQWQLDYQAVDTVTNFTTLVDKLQARQIEEVYLITSDYHMRRASVVAQIVLGSRGIGFQPVAVTTGHGPERPETILKEVRDGVRSLLWVLTGKTGSEWRQALRHKP